MAPEDANARTLVGLPASDASSDAFQGDSVTDDKLPLSSKTLQQFGTTRASQPPSSSRMPLVALVATGALATGIVGGVLMLRGQQDKPLESPPATSVVPLTKTQSEIAPSRTGVEPEESQPATEKKKPKDTFPDASVEDVGTADGQEASTAAHRDASLLLDAGLQRGDTGAGSANEDGDESVEEEAP